MAKKIKMVGQPAAKAATPTPRDIVTSPLPLGGFSPGVNMQTLPQFPPELSAAIKNARDNCEGRWMILVFTAKPDNPKAGGYEVSLHTTKGPNWNDDWYLRSYRLFIARMLEFNNRIVEFLTPKKPAPEPAKE